MESNLVLLGLITLVSNFVGTVSGFGGMILCITLGADLYSIKELVYTFVPLSIFQGLYLTLRHHRHIDKKTLFKVVLPFMGVGVPIGLVLSHYLPGNFLKNFFFIFVFSLSLKELFFLFKNKESLEIKTLHPWVSKSLVFLTGIIQGLYATGGPILVYVLSKYGLKKHAFRSTMVAVFLILNTFLTATFAFMGHVDSEILHRILFLALFIPLGTWLGEAVHAKISDRNFKIMTFVLLCLSSANTLYRSIF